MLPLSRAEQAAVESRLRMIEQEDEPSTEYVVKPIPAVRLAAVTDTMSASEMGNRIGPMFDRAAAVLADAKASRATPIAPRMPKPKQERMWSSAMPRTARHFPGWTLSSCPPGKPCVACTWEQWTASRSPGKRCISGSSRITMSTRDLVANSMSSRLLMINTIGSLSYNNRCSSFPGSTARCPHGRTAARH